MAVPAVNITIEQGADLHLHLRLQMQMVLYIHYQVQVQPQKSKSFQNPRVLILFQPRLQLQQV